VELALAERSAARTGRLNCDLQTTLTVLWLLTRMNSTALTDAVTEVIRRAPEWVRRDLTSSNAKTRRRAEETLAGIIAAALDLDNQSI